jgi:hypothetical protein
MIYPKNSMPKRDLFLAVGLLLGGMSGRHQYHQRSVLQEYCDDKSFVPTCSASDEVIIMEQATYGRMRLGKCVPEDFAFAYWDVQLTCCHLLK